MEIKYRMSPWAFQGLKPEGAMMLDVNDIAKAISQSLAEHFPNVTVSVVVDYNIVSGELSVTGAPEDVEEWLLDKAFKVVIKAIKALKLVPMEPNISATHIVYVDLDSYIEVYNPNHIVLYGWLGYCDEPMEIGCEALGLHLKKFKVRLRPEDYGAFWKIARMIAKGEPIPTTFSLGEEGGDNLWDLFYNELADPDADMQPIAAYDPETDTAYIIVTDEGMHYAGPRGCQLLGISPGFRVPRPDEQTTQQEE